MKKNMAFKRSFLIGGMIFFLFSCTFNQTKKADKVSRYVAEDRAYPRELKEGLFYTDLSSKNTFELGSNAKVVFNLPPYTNPGNVGILPLMLQTIDNAKHSIRMSVFQFNHKDVFSALIRAAERKVKIYIATDLCYSGKAGYKEYFDELRSRLNTLGQNGAVQVVDDKTPSCETMFNHNKYMIVDYEDEKLVKAWFGSFNPTNHGAQENVELSILANNKKLADILKLDFDQQMSGVFKVNKKGVFEVKRDGNAKIEALSEVEIKELLKNKVKISYPKVMIGSTQFEFILSPKVKSLSRIIEEVYNAKKEILFSSFAIADQMLISSLINKSKTTTSKYNLFSILMLPHPGDGGGPEFVYNGNSENKKAITNSSELSSIVDEIKNSYATPTNYLTPKSELKGTFKYIYPKGSAGGEILKVHVEGIFNSKIIDEKNTYQRLLSQSVPLYKSSLYGELHNKLFLIDGETTIFGSHNFSQSAENSNDELTVIIKSNALTSFLRQELYFKTKAMSVSENRPMPSFTGGAGVALTEIMSESEFKMKWNNKVADVGDYIELYNYSEYPVNLLGFRIDDHYFPEQNNEKLDVSTFQGVQSTLVRFYPNKVINTLGTIDNNPKNNVLMPGQTALVVGKYFHESYYKKKFEEAFYKINKRAPRELEYPILFSSNEYFSSVLGDSATGLSSKDKVTLFGIDGMTVIDRFSYPKKTQLGYSLERNIDIQKLKSVLNSRNYELRTLSFNLKNGTNLVDKVYAPIPDYNTEGEWGESEGRGSPGVINGVTRAPSSVANLFTVEGEFVDVYTNTFKSGLVVIKDGKIFDITNVGNTKYPAPLIRDVLIYPGLIDAHNHIKYNTMPIWTVSKTYNNRDEWPNEIVYKNAIKEIYKGVYSNWPECNSSNELEKNKCLAQKRCQILFFAELKALIGGTTSIQGSSSFDESSSDITFKGLSGYTAGSGNSITKSKARQLEDLLDSCSSDFARNIEREKWRGSDVVRTTAQSIYAEAWAKTSLVDPVKSKQGPSYKLIEEFKNKITEKFFIHLGEGKDTYSLSEYAELKTFKLNVPETTVIHGTAFDDSVLNDMGKNGISLAWSPTSNLLLYKKTTDIPSALKNKVNVALGSDWSLSGTKSLLDELKVAVKVNDKYFSKAISKSDLLKMVTINGARASGVIDLVGSIEKNKLADFFIVQNSEKFGTPLDTLVKITEDKILSVFVGGRPLIGKSEVLSSFQSENVTKIDDGSCSDNLYVNMDKNTFDSIISNLASKTEKSFLSLSPKLKTAVGEDFKFLDPICGKKDERYQKILNSL